MVRINTVWDSAVEAVRGRAGLIAPIATAAIFLPSVAQAAVQAYLAPQPGAVAAAGSAAVGSLVTIIALVVTLWGALAITAITSHPSTTSADATRQATARLLPLIGVSLVIGFALTLLGLPLIALLIAAGVDFENMTPGQTPQISGGLGALAFLYMLVLLGLLLWIFARLLPLVPTVLHERLGVRAIGRAFRMTKGMGLKLVGVVLLYFIVLIVASGAAQLVFGLVARFALGQDGSATAQFVGGIASAVVATILSVLSYAFVARLYAMLSGRDLADVFEDARSPA
ncbi:hypothetical protein [Sphingomonas lenta]|uniref:Glycerophosphoryl diester phosphodiesterase membrane domain-containing protein n=1 Tax=Sphingomonas lenta TaxID=1141887 RepID=A0A2A2SJL6_9SPHN|nr:hypothetical protein [Sphingomonas lenta]PAX09436.1 hypothetical protein CKY28_01385 [Sphingomonas lenta]